MFFTRRVVGWAVSTKHNADLTALALLDAITFNPIPKISHSDQVSEYRDKPYLNLLKSLNIKPSMSAKSSPWQNGYEESFYSGFKLELGQPEIYPTLGELYEAMAACRLNICFAVMLFVICTISEDDRTGTL